MSATLTEARPARIRIVDTAGFNYLTVGDVYSVKRWSGDFPLVQDDHGVETVIVLSAWEPAHE